MIRRLPLIACTGIMSVAVAWVVLSIEQSRQYKGPIPQWELDAKTKSGDEMQLEESRRLGAASRAEGDTTISPHRLLLHKLKTLVVTIDLKQASTDDVINGLKTASVTADPEHKGVQFALNGSAESLNAPATLRIENVPLINVLKQLQRLFGLAYSVGDSSVIIWRDNGEGLTRRTFIVGTGIFQITSQNGDSEPYDVKEQLIARGINFPPGTGAVYLPSKKELIVTNSSTETELIDEILNP